MASIKVLDQITIDKIAAGEVIERPSSIVKELVENAIDAGSTSITVEIKEGGIAFIRISDNGSGIASTDIPNAFLRHSTSKISTIDDLDGIQSLGFRGEALSSIAAVSKVELITKEKQAVSGSKYIIEGGLEYSFEECAAPDGTTFLVKQLFYNTPARRKFLKSAVTEASHIGELLTRLALSHPEIAFTFINNNTTKLQTAGTNNLKDVIYKIYGRDITSNLLEIAYEKNDFKVTGFVGKPVVSRGNRNYENFFINGRYVKSHIISKGIEDAYKGYSMQHRYPFVAFHIEMIGNEMDVNVHPTKMELRFTNQNTIYNHIYHCVRTALEYKPLIPEVELTEIELPRVETPKVEFPKVSPPILKKEVVEVNNNKIISKPHRNTNRYGSSLTPKQEKENLDYFMEKMKKRVSEYHQHGSSAEVIKQGEIHSLGTDSVQNKIKEAVQYAVKEKKNETQQLNLFDEKVLERDIKKEFTLIGQVFQTYWLVEYSKQLYIIDQHAAHEKVLYEETIKGLKTKDYTTQYISPPIVISLSMQEKLLLENNLEAFQNIGYELEEFGSDAYAIRGVPDNLYSIAKKELFLEMLDELSLSIQGTQTTEMIIEKIASLSCKAAVKGKSTLSALEMKELVGKLLSLDQPFHCPHGRPTIIVITEKEMEKKFKRII